MSKIFSLRVDGFPKKDLGKSCSFDLLYESFVNVCHFVYVCPSFPFGFEDGMWDLIVLILDPVVHNIVSLTSLLRCQVVKCFTTL